MNVRSLRRAMLAGLGLVLLLGASSARAGEPRTHDGFFLRLSTGLGYGSTSIDDVELKGPAGDLNLAIGGCLSPNFALHATIWGWSAPDPDIEFNGSSGSLDDSSISMSGVGIGITYYFMPANFYLSPSVGLSSLSLDLDNVSVSSDTGFGLEMTLGKEWWVSDGWGLGIAGDVSYHNIPDGDIDENWSGLGVGVRFSATMN